MSSTPIQFFAKQKRIYPKRAWGRYRKVKWGIMFLAFAVYYLVPFIRWDRGPHAPDQAVLIDMIGRRAYFFFVEIWPQEVYYLTGILILAAVGLFFVTSLLGRVWCGYFCFQTIWTDLFIWVERIVQGDRNQRMKLDKSPLSFEKIWKKALTHAIWIVIGLFTGGAWVLYFNDAPTVIDQILHWDLPWAVTSWILALTGTTYLMAGFAREQVCTYMCPYSRFQSAMFDKDSLVIAYDEDRGEPRGKHKAGDTWEGRGHCIDCTLCVQVCPMGIDIRNGLQMECIACGLCVDACNEVMDKVGLPKGLVRYDTTHNKEQRAAGKPEYKHLVRPRSLWYVLILSIVGGMMLYGLVTRAPVELHVLHDRNPLFVTLSNGDIRNGYDIKILNKTHDDKRYSLRVEGIENVELTVQGAGNLQSDALPVFADSVGHFRVFLHAPKQVEPRQGIVFTLKDTATQLEETNDSIFISAQPK